MNVCELMQDAETEVLSSLSAWKNFLHTVGNNHKYSYPNQLLIYSQRPDATACADIKIWNKLGCMVLAEAEAIVLYNDTGPSDTLRYVFDVADVHAVDKQIPRWEFSAEKMPSVLTELQQQYELGEYTEDAWIDLLASAIHKEYEADAVVKSFSSGERQLLENAALYAVLFRMGLGGIVSDNFFSGFSAYDIPRRRDILAYVSFGVHPILNAVGKAIKDYKKYQFNNLLDKIDSELYNSSENITEKGDEYEHQLQETQGLPIPDDIHEEPEGNRPVWANPEGLPEGEQTGTLQQAAHLRRTEQSSDGDRPDSPEANQGSDKKPNGTLWRVGAAESAEPHGMDKSDKHNQKSSSRKRKRRSPFQLNMDIGEDESFPFFYTDIPTVTEQLSFFTEHPEIKGTEMFQEENDIIRDKPENIIACFVKSKLEAKEKFNSKALFAEATKAYRDTMANNAFTSKDAYDAMELGVNQYILASEHVTPESMLAMLDLLPTQTRRTADMEKFQQFSTPPSIAYLANFAANVNTDDIMLEPSAGNGGLAVFAKKDGAKVYVNELDKRRLELIKNLPFDGFFNEDAEQINNIHGDKIAPTVIVMNPPFSSSAERNIHNSKIGAKHIEEALKILAPNGRLVAIVGQGMADDVPAFRNWWRGIKEEYNVRANIGIDGKNYNKYGTNFGIQMLVIDKIGATSEPVKTAFVENVLELQIILGGIRNDRPSIQLNKDNRNEQNSVAAARSDIAVERESEYGQSYLISDAGGRTDTAVTGDRYEPSVPSEADTDSRGNADTSSEPANVNDDGPTPIVNAERHGGNDGRNDGDAVIGRTGAADSRESAGSFKPLIRQPKAVKTELTDSIFEQYEPQPLLLNNVQPHPANISESAAMSAIQPPPVTYKPKISQSIIDNGVLSDVQLEAVSYAGQSHSQTLPDGSTRGFFLGDGTGVGKGRTITGVILDNYAQGRKKSVWLSENRGLVPDAKRDVKALFGDADSVVEFQGGKKADASLSMGEGILFATYSSLSKGFDQSESNFEKIVRWLGKDFDGVIVFDEAHNMANSIVTKGSRGIKKASQRGMAGLAIQDALPKAKIIYSSATGATEVENLRYAERLGLWGEGTAFPNGDTFVHKIKSGGLAAMELIARDMKAMGVYLSRNISYEDVVYDKIVHELTPEQRQIYDELARSWQIVLQNINKALETTNQIKDGMAKGKAYGAFWSAEQRFFNQILTAMQVPSMMADMQTQLDNDNSIVIQLVSTNEAAQEREFTRLQEQGLELEDFDLTPKQMLMSYIENSFPTIQFEAYMDEKGNLRSKPVYDSKGNAVINREAVRQREELLDKLGSIKVPASALDMIINHFGSDMVAENTGRKRRVVVKDGKAREENIASKKEADVSAFQDGDKRIIIFSKAGGTGKSYHADKSAKNQQHRVHYLLQAGWQADAAVQGFGRSHRSYQVSSPTFVLVTTDLKGQMRFISTIAKRLDQLGALTKGQRQTGSQGLFTAGDNLENSFAADVLAMYYKTLICNCVDGISDGVAIIEKLGLKEKLIDEYGQINPNANELREVNKFLNRILSLECSEQNAVFDGYAERLHMTTEKALRDGTLDRGLENYRADMVVLNETQDIQTDKSTGAVTKYYNLTAHNKIKSLQFGDVNTQSSSFLGFYQNKNTGVVRAVFKTSSMTDEYGNVSDNCRLTGQDGNEYMPQSRLTSNWVELTPQMAENLWNDAISQLPEFHTGNLHLIGGAVLPVWDKLPTENVRIYRVLTTDGDLLIGRVIPEKMIDTTLRRLDASREKENIKTEDLIKSVKNGNTVHLDNGWRITQKRVSGEQRLEIIGASYLSSGKLIKKGVFTERIGFQTRYFIPTEKDTVRILDEVLKVSPVSRIEHHNECITEKIKKNNFGIHKESISKKMSHSAIKATDHNQEFPSTTVRERENFR